MSVQQITPRQIATGSLIPRFARLASTAAVTITYAATGGAMSRGQITAAPNTLDGISLVATNRILLKNQASAAQNGIYYITTLGTGANGVWDRAVDFDHENDLNTGIQIYIQEGTVNAISSWTLTSVQPLTVGGGSGSALNFAGIGLVNAVSEQAGGTPNNILLNFTASQTPIPSTLLVFLNGFYQAPGGNDYTLSGLTISFINAPTTGDLIWLEYFFTPITAGAQATYASEAPSGTPNNILVTFNLTITPRTNSLVLFLNGNLQKPGIAYSLSGTTITFNSGYIPEAGDELWANYAY